MSKKQKTVQAGGRAKYSNAQRDADYKSVFEGTAEGRRVLADIMAKGFVFSPIQTLDPIAAARIEGARQLALHIGSFVAFSKRHWTEIVRDVNGSLGEDD